MEQLKCHLEQMLGRYVEICMKKVENNTKFVKATKVKLVSKAIFFSLQNVLKHTVILPD